LTYKDANTRTHYQYATVRGHLGKGFVATYAASKVFYRITVEAITRGGYLAATLIFEFWRINLAWT
jgi:hypothetical protein